MNKIINDKLEIYSDESDKEIFEEDFWCKGTLSLGFFSCWVLSIVFEIFLLNSRLRNFWYKEVVNSLVNKN